VARPFPAFAFNNVVAGSPAAAAETVICTLSGVNTDGPTQHVFLFGWCAFTVGATGTAVRLRLRQTSVTGTTVVDTGALTGGVAAAGLVSYDLNGIDQPGDVNAFVYVMTLQVTGGSGVSTVSAANLLAIISN
jgi:hypothetical protein